MNDGEPLRIPQRLERRQRWIQAKEAVEIKRRVHAAIWFWNREMATTARCDSPGTRMRIAGLLLRWSGRVALFALIAVQLLSFSALMSVVLASGIPIADCGCFGHLGLPETPLQDRKSVV